MKKTIIYCSYYKNKIEQKPGWNNETLNWCLDEAKKAMLKDSDYWGALVLDEMKIQVFIIIAYVKGKWESVVQ